MLSETDTHKIAFWALGTDTGMSSKNVARAAMGLPVEPYTYPRDGDDLGRCLRLIEFCPAAKAGVDALANISGPWKRLASRWDELEAMHAANDKQLYREMQKLINPNDLRSYSWTKNEHGFWDMNSDFDAGSARSVEIRGGSVRFGSEPEA